LARSGFSAKLLHSILSSQIVAGSIAARAITGNTSFFGGMVAVATLVLGIFLCRANLRDKEVQEVSEIFQGYGLRGGELTTVVTAITSDRERWLDFMMRFELGLEEPNPNELQ
jgi:hypothetical protein